MPVALASYRKWIALALLLLCLLALGARYLYYASDAELAPVLSVAVILFLVLYWTDTDRTLKRDLSALPKMDTNKLNQQLAITHLLLGFSGFAIPVGAFMVSSIFSGPYFSGPYWALFNGGLYVFPCSLVQFTYCWRYRREIKRTLAAAV